MVRKYIKPNSNISIRLPNNVDTTILDWINIQSKLSSSILTLIKNEVSKEGIKDLTPTDPVPKIKVMLDLIFDCIRDNYKKGKLQTEVSEIYKYIQEKLDITDEVIAIPSKVNKSKYKNRCRFAILTLIKYGVLETVDDYGAYSLSDIGQYYLNTSFNFESYKANLEANFIHQKIEPDNL